MSTLAMMRPEMIWGLDSTEWSVVATIAQAGGAVGALSLLLITWRASRSAKDSVASSQQLAIATDGLVKSSLAQQELAVVPVIEVAHETNELRFRLINKGNGPLVSPTFEIAGARLKVVAEDPTSHRRGETGALAVGNLAYALVDTHISTAGEIRISGVSLTGTPYNAAIPSDSLAGGASIVARQVQL